MNQDFKQRLRKWRSGLSIALFLALLTGLVYWTWQHQLIIQQILRELGPLKVVELVFLFMVAILLSALNFTVLVRSMDYQFTYINGYHSLNLSQVAAMVPGKIWGFAGLAGLLWTQGISKRDSVLIIFLYTIFMLSAAVLVGTVGLIPAIGWGYTFLCLLPVLILLLGRSWLDPLRLRFFAGSSPLPSALNMVFILLIGMISWVVMSVSFALLVYGAEGRWPVSPWLIASAFPAGYVVGFISLIAPSGLGVREGIIVIILGPSLSHEKALALAIVFRVLHTIVLWLNIMISLSALTVKAYLSNMNIKLKE